MELQLVVLAYVVVGIAKTILAACSLPAAMATVRRRSGKPGWGLPLLVVIGALIVSFLFWPLLLFHEREKFFVLYRKRRTIREVLEALRESAGLLEGRRRHG